MAKVFKSVLILFGFLPFSSPVMHSLLYYSTATSGVKFTHIPEFVDMTVIDGEVIASYDSFSQDVTLKTDLADTVDKESEALRAKDTEISLKAQIETLKERLSQTAGVYVYQRMSGCEWDNETGTIDTYEQHGYNGEDFLSLNIHQMRWIAAVPEALPSKYERDGNRGELISIKSFLTQECTDRLKKYVASNVLQPTVPPEVSLLQDSSSSLVVCHATGFYPNRVMITWKRDGVEMWDDVDVGETLPNHDGTFQKRVLLTVPPEERKKSSYTCEVYHQSSTEPYTKILDENLDGNTTRIIIGSVVLALVLIGPIVVAVFMMKKGAGMKRPVTQEDKKLLASESPQAFDPSHPIKTFDGILASSGYGDAEDKALFMLSSLAVCQQQKEAIERATVGQNKNALWMAYRNNRLTASNFGLVLAAVRRNSYPPSLFETLLGQDNLKQGAHACDWGIEHEEKAKQEYMERTGVTIQEKGVFLSDSGLLGGSPDGMVSDDRIIEVKCPYAAREKTILQAAEAKDFFLQLDEVTGSLKLKPTHNHWHQIQGNLHLTGASTCDLVVWTPLDLAVLLIHKDPAWASNIEVLETFYKDCFLPHVLSQM